MTSSDRLQAMTFLIGIVLIPLTALSIYLIYGPSLFDNWPWIRFSIVMSTLTCLWTYTFWFVRLTTRNEGLYNPILFAVVVIPFNIILMYPGPKNIGIDSDPSIYYLIFTLEIIHGLGFYLIQREIKKYLMAI